MRNRTQLTVRLYPGDRQDIQLAAMNLGLSMGEFTRICAAETARKVVAEMREDFYREREVIEGEFVDPQTVSKVRKMPQLPDVPVQNDFDKAENALHTRIKARSYSHG